MTNNGVNGMRLMDADALIEHLKNLQWNGGNLKLNVIIARRELPAPYIPMESMYGI